MTRKRLAILLLARGALLLGISLSAAAQSGSGDLTGNVTDTSGAAVAGARVEARSALGEAIRTETSSGGRYVLTSLRPGSYAVRIEASGFATLERVGVTVRTGERVALDLQLRAGDARQVVTVTADAPLLQRESGSLATGIASRSVEQLPLNGRNVVSLVTLAPGVSLPPGTLLPRINGGRPRTNEYLYDGVSALQPEPGQVAFFPIIDDIAEFAVQSSGVSAEFGRFNGGVVNLSTRSGSKVLHGELYDFLRNEDLNARNYFVPVGTAKPIFRRNQYGGALGGPLAGAAKKGRLFFFADYQGTNQAVGVVRTSTVPTLAQRGFPDAQGRPTQALSFMGTKIYDPASTLVTGSTFSRTEFANDEVPIQRLDSAALALLARYPLPTNNRSANNYTRVGNDSDHQNQFDVRLDLVLSRRDRGAYAAWADSGHVFELLDERDASLRYGFAGAGPARAKDGRGPSLGASGCGAAAESYGEFQLLDSVHESARCDRQRERSGEFPAGAGKYVLDRSTAKHATAASAYCGGVRAGRLESDAAFDDQCGDAVDT